MADSFCEVFYSFSQKNNIESYLLNLFNILKLIKKVNEDLRENYANIVISQLSDNELTTISYYCLYLKYNSDQLFFELVEEFLVLRNFSVNASLPHRLPENWLENFYPENFKDNVEIKRNCLRHLRHKAS